MQAWIGTERHGMVRYGGAGLERFGRSGAAWWGTVRKSIVRCGEAGLELKSLVMS